MSELSSVHCADCGRLICYSGSQPYGLLVCPECYAIRESTEKPQSATEGER